MAALAASVPPWIPEDDLLLKNALEAGASLEALAKGAVRFSRKFSVRELRDRWHSLLYDPAISAEASARMIECDLSVPNHKMSPELSVKRKLECVRRLYYAMRKKARKRSGNCPGFSLLGGPNIDEIPIHSPVQGGNGLSGDQNLTDFGLVGKKFYSDLHVKSPSLTLVDEEIALSHPVPESNTMFHPEELPSSLELWETMEDISAPVMPLSVNNEVEGQGRALVHHDDDVKLDGNEVSLSDMNFVGSGAILHHKDSSDVHNTSTVISESDYADLSESLLNFANEDELLLADEQGEDQMDKSCHDRSLVSCPNDIHDKELDMKGPKALIPEQALVTADSTDFVEAIVEGSLCSVVEQRGNLCTESSMLSSVSTANVEPFDGDMECTLNSEDPEIPCNDDVLLPKRTTSSAIGTASRKMGYRPYLFANLKDEKQEKSLLRKEEMPTLSSVASHKGAELLLPTRISQQLVGCEGKSESPDHVAFIQASNAHRDENQCGTARISSTSAAVGVPKTEALHTSNALDLPLCTTGYSVKQVTSVSEADPIMLNQEESESDEDMPSYADIEALILGMDLCPDDTDSCINREVLRYQNDDTRRNIIRLEQCAQSSIQRSIAFRGALAVLYGHYLKHFIRETEVILGRATEDMEIDIDLGREGPANKISRRQALIKMEADGSFLLKNLGKSLVFLNGQEVTTGQSMILSSGGLIEIGEMAFMFEINMRAVRQHLRNSAINRQENSMKFEWSEGVPV